MHVTVTRVRTADQPTRNATIVGEEMARWLRDVEGFAGFMLLSQPGTTLGVSFWESREVAERHRAARLEFVQRMTAVAGVEIEDVQDYELTFADLPGLRDGPA
jgi:hypothetical protein